MSAATIPDGEEWLNELSDMRTSRTSLDTCTPVHTRVVGGAARAGAARGEGRAPPLRLP